MQEVKSNGKTRYKFYYYCNGRKKKVDGINCDMPLVLGYEIEDFVWKEVRKVIDNPKILIDALKVNSYQDKLKSYDKEIEKLNKQIALKDASLTRNFELYETGKIDQALILDRLEKIKKEKENIQGRINVLKQSSLEQKKFINNAKQMQNQLEYLSKNLYDFSDEQKARFLKQILDKVEVHCQGKGKRGSGNYVIKLHFNSLFLNHLSSENDKDDDSANTKVLTATNKNMQLLHNVWLTPCTSPPVSISMMPSPD